MVNFESHSTSEHFATVAFGRAVFGGCITAHVDRTSSGAFGTAVGGFG